MPFFETVAPCLMKVYLIPPCSPFTHVEGEASELTAVDECDEGTEKHHQQHVAAAPGTLIALVGAVPATVRGVKSLWLSHDVIPHDLCKGRSLLTKTSKIIFLCPGKLDKGWSHQISTILKTESFYLPMILIYLCNNYKI